MLKVCVETWIEDGFGKEEFKSIDLVNPIMSKI